MDNFIIDIPDFLVEYQEDVQYGYSSEKSKRNLRSVLDTASSTARTAGKRATLPMTLSPLG